MFQMSNCRKFTGEYEGFTTKISKFIVHIDFKRTFHVENMNYP